MSTRENTGMVLGLIGVVIFNLTLPMTRIVVQEIHPLLNGLGRALFVGDSGGVALLWRREKWPTCAQFKGLTLVVAWRDRRFPGAIGMGDENLARLPRRTGQWPATVVVAIYAAWLSHERPSKAFWACAAMGSALVLGYALISGAGNLQAGDVLMVGAVASAGWVMPKGVVGEGNAAGR